MTADIIGISGSPVKNSNTDRLVMAILDASGLDYEFVKLSDILVRPCMACKRCVTDNVCRQEDDFPALAQKILDAKALVIGAYTPYGQIDAFTKALLERFWCFRHVKNLLRGKLCATVLTSLVPDMAAGVNQALAMELVQYERMVLLGQVMVTGHIPCLTCGRGDDCEMSGISLLFGPDAKAADQAYCRVEDQAPAWDEALAIGREMGIRVSN